MARHLVIQLERLGDLILTTLLLQELHESCPEDTIDLLVLEETRIVLDGLAGISAVHALPERLVRQLIQEIRATYPDIVEPEQAATALRRLGLSHYDRLINLTLHEFGCWLAARIPATVREGGLITDDGEWLSCGDWHTYLISRTDFRFENGFHVADLCRVLAPARRSPGEPRRPHVARASDLSFSLPPGRLVALNPGSSKQARRWPADHFAAVAAGLRARGFTPILVGAPADRKQCAEVAAAGPEPPADFCGRTTIPEAARLLGEAELLISGDTGAVHLAAAVGTPVVGVYGGSTVFRETAPYGDGNLIVQASLSRDGSTMAEIPPAAVLAAAAVRLGLEDRAFLLDATREAHVKVWETFFLPAEADPLGGISFRPLFAATYTTADMLLLILRHVYAWEFCGRRGSVSIDHLRDLLALDHVALSREDLRGVNKMTGDMQRLLRALADTASEAESLCYDRDSRAMDRIQSYGDQIQQGVGTLKTAARRVSFIRPVVLFLEWTLRNLPRLDAAALFRRHESELARAADVLAEATALLRELLEE